MKHLGGWPSYCLLCSWLWGLRAEQCSLCHSNAVWHFTGPTEPASLTLTATFHRLALEPVNTHLVAAVSLWKAGPSEKSEAVFLYTIKQKLHKPKQISDNTKEGSYIHKTSKERGQLCKCEVEATVADDTANPQWIFDDSSKDLHERPLKPGHC